MKVKVNITYSALKLARRLPEMIGDYIQNSGNSTIENARRIIDSKDHEKPKLSARTIRKRKAGLLENKKWGTAKFGDVPLKYTGRFYNTMQANKDGITMEKYGYYHNIGFSDEISRPKRTFLKFKESEKAEKQFKEDLRKNFRK